jgi:serine/threonine protein phosphatase 1
VCIQIDVSEWRAGDIDANGDVIFAIGDVHGCARLLSALLHACAHLHDHHVQPGRLVFLGDVINRGPSTMEALHRWAQEEPIPGVRRVDRLMGNHEQLLRLAAQPSDEAARAHEMFLAVGGDRFLQELRALTERPNAELNQELLEQALGVSTWRLLRTGLVASVRVGNLTFVHAGVDPHTDLDDFLALKMDALPVGDRHWAWIERDFLTWRAGFNGQIVVHGHVPPHAHHQLTAQHDPHVLCYGRLSLDGGSALTNVVVGVQIQDGQYRIVRAIGN